jgi:hypothetical protein
MARKLHFHKQILSSPVIYSIIEDFGQREAKYSEEAGMLETILIILVVLWALGLFAFHAGGLIHVLLVIAAIVLVVRLLQGRRVL